MSGYHWQGTLALGFFAAQALGVVVMVRDGSHLMHSSTALVPLFLPCRLLWLVLDPCNKLAGRIVSVCLAAGIVALCSSSTLMMTGVVLENWVLAGGCALFLFALYNFVTTKKDR